jgi:signal transduction histidine kinase
MLHIREREKSGEGKNNHPIFTSPITILRFSQRTPSSMSLRLRLFLGQILAVAAMVLIAWAAGATARVLVLIAVGGLAAGLVSVLWWVRTFNHTFNAFSIGSQQVAAGNFTPLDIPARDPELTPVSTAFNDMVTALQSRDHQLQQYHFEQARRVRELNALAEISRNVNSSLNGREVLRTILNETVKSFPTARKALIHLVDESRQRLVPVVLSDTTAPPSPTQGMPLDQGIAGRCVREARTITVLDTTTHPDFLDLGSNVRSLMVTPLIIGDRVIGALSIDSTRRDAFSGDMETVFRLLADRAANALENARLYEESQARVQQLTRLLHLTTDLSGQQGTAPLHQQLVQGAATLLNASEGVLLLRHINNEMRVTSHWHDASSANGNSQRAALPIPAVLAQVVHSGEPLLFERANGQRVLPQREMADAMAAPLIWKGTVLGVIVLFKRDAPSFDTAQLGLLALFAQHGAGVLENMRLVSELQETNADLSRASQLKSEFLANMSHELRTPLNAILGFSEILIDQTFGELNERQSRYLNNINNSGRHLLDLINDILDLSKIEAGKMEMQAEPFRLDGALQEVYTIIEPLAAKKSLKITLDHKEAPQRIMADRLRFKQILYNIMSNAVKFTPDNGLVTVRAWGETDEAGEPQTYISVKDTGIGIPSDQLERIFDVFHRLDRGYRSATEGTGLGLALVRRFVQLHGGEVTATSEPGQGSTFTIRIPQEQVVISE